MPASRITNTPKILGPEQVICCGSWTFEDSTTPDTAADVVGFGASVARTADGVYTITMMEKYPFLQCAIIQGSGIVGVDNAALLTPSRSYDAATGVVTVTFEIADGTDTIPTDEGRLDYFLVFQPKTILGQS